MGKVGALTPTWVFILSLTLYATKMAAWFSQSQTKNGRLIFDYLLRANANANANANLVQTGSKDERLDTESCTD